MPGTLTVSIEIPAATVPCAKIAAFKVECNIERWIDVWVTYGDDKGGLDRWIEHVHPVFNMVIPPTRIRIENGNHPLRPGTVLRRCPTCGKWFGLELVCDETDCAGAVLVPYDGLDRFCCWETSGNTPYVVLQEALYEFLMNEEVPDPDTWELRKVLPITDWHP